MKYTKSDNLKEINNNIVRIVLNAGSLCAIGDPINDSFVTVNEPVSCNLKETEIIEYLKNF